VEVLESNRPLALLQFAGRAILDEVKEKKRRWTWGYFAARRDDRNVYVERFRKKLLETATPEVRIHARIFGYSLGDGGDGGAVETPRSHLSAVPPLRSLLIGDF